MHTVTIHTPGDVAVGDAAPEPAPGPEDVVVEVAACGVCGTDLHIADGDFAPTPYPVVPGHEFSGTVVAVGADVRTGARVGDRVAVDPSLFCGHCAACRRGRGNLCAHWGATGVTVDGAFAERVAVPAVNAHRMPEEMTFEQGALVEPLSCAVHGMRRLGVEVGESVLVLGAGTMGLLLVQLLERSGARVTAVDRVPQKRSLAERCGAAATAADLGDLDGRRYDAVVDVTGVPEVVEQGIAAVARGGRFLVFGVAPADARIGLSPFRVYNDEVTVLGSMAVLHSFGTALGLIAGGEVRTDGLVTHTVPLVGYHDALAAVRGGEAVKVHVHPGRRE